MEWTFVGCAISRECHNNVSCYFVLLSESCTYGKSITTTNNTVSSVVTFFKVSQMHRTTTALRNTGCFTSKFCHHFIQIHVLGDRLSVTTVIWKEDIVIAQVLNSPNVGCFLTNWKVSHPLNKTTTNQFINTWIKFTNTFHFSEHLKMCLFRKFYHIDLLYRNFSIHLG